MDRLSKLVAAAALSLGASVAHAGYAYPVDPPGFTRSGGTSFQGIGYSINSANDKTFGRVVYQSNGLKVPVPGKPVTMPVSYRFAANAPRVAAMAVFANPQLRLAVGIASWLGVAKLVWDEVDRVWKMPVQDSQQQPFQYKYTLGVHPFNQTDFESAEDACIAYAASIGGTFREATSSRCLLRDKTGYPIDLPIIRTQLPCPVGWQTTPAGCLSPDTQQIRKVETPEEFADQLAPKPMPETVPFELPPGTPLPVVPPVINPTPGDNPQPRPMFVPDGNPVQNPNYNPNGQPSPENQPWIQPGIRINPSPTPEEPFRLDIKPVERPVPLPDPMPGPESEGDGQGDTAKPEELQSLCEKHPDILACAKMDEPHEEELPQEEKPIEITPDSGWGADGASCPAPKMISVQGRQIAVPFDLFCKYMDGMRPIILAMAWLSAAFILVGAREGS